MIQETEIRIGNWFTHNENWSYRRDADIGSFNFQWENRDWYALGECTISLDNIEPIALTPELLLQCGFENKKISPDYWELPDEKCIESWATNFSYYLPYYTLDTYTGSIKIKYLHQLQNLYYSLTGKELTVNIIQCKKY